MAHLPGTFPGPPKQQGPRSFRSGGLVLLDLWVRFPAAGGAEKGGGGSVPNKIAAPATFLRHDRPRDAEERGFSMNRQCPDFGRYGSSRSLQATKEETVEVQGYP